MKTRKLSLIGERDVQRVIAHRGIEASIELYRGGSGAGLEFEWVSTAAITPTSVAGLLKNSTAVWCTPGSPYASTAGALLAIQYARVQHKAFFGTCGGFQHALMEFAQNVLGRPAEHEEMSPGATEPLIMKLSCSLAGAKGKVIAAPQSRFAQWLGARESIEEFNCNYGMNDGLAGIFDGSDVEFVAHDDARQIRAFLLRGHPFFLGTLFQPERQALTGSIHPLVAAFLNSV